MAGLISDEDFLGAPAATQKPGLVDRTVGAVKEFFGGAKPAAPATGLLSDDQFFGGKQEEPWMTEAKKGPGALSVVKDVGGYTLGVLGQVEDMLASVPRLASIFGAAGTAGVAAAKGESAKNVAGAALAYQESFLPEWTQGAFGKLASALGPEARDYYYKNGVARFLEKFGEQVVDKSGKIEERTGFPAEASQLLVNATMDYLGAKGTIAGVKSSLKMRGAAEEARQSKLYAERQAPVEVEDVPLAKPATPEPLQVIETRKQVNEIFKRAKEQGDLSKQDAQIVAGIFDAVKRGETPIVESEGAMPVRVTTAEGFKGISENDLLKWSAELPPTAKLALAGTALGAALYGSQEDLVDQDKALLAAGLIGAMALRGKAKFLDLPEFKQVEAMRNGEPGAFDAWYEKNKKQLNMTAIRKIGQEHAPDLAQHAVTKLLSALQRPVDAPGGFRGDASVMTWLTTVMENDKNTFLRQKARMPSASLDEQVGGKPGEEGTATLGDTIAGPDVSLERVNDSQKLGQKMQDALNKLPDSQRRAFELAELEGLSMKEIAEQTGQNEMTVRTQIHRARQSLQQSLRDYRPESGKADPYLLGLTALTGGAAALGAYLDSDKPLRGAALGAIGVPGFAALMRAGAGKGLDYALGNVSTRLGIESPQLKLRARNFEAALLEKTDKALDQVAPFLKGLNKLKGADKERLNQALLENDPHQIAAVLRGKPEMVAAWRQVQNLLANFKDKQVALGRFKEGLSDYFPRIVKDLPGLKAALGQEQRTHLEESLVRAEAKMQKTQGRELTDVERSIIVNNSLHATGSSARLPAFAKARGIRDLTTDLAKFYERPTDALLRYVRGAVDDLEVAKFFGKDLVSKKVAGGKMATDVDASIGQILERGLKTGEVTGQNVEALRSLLQSRFKGGETAMHGIVQDIRNVTNIGLLGSFHSAATQIGDSIMTIYHHGLLPTLGALKQQLTGTAKITTKEFGLVNHVAEELGSARATGRALQTVFKLNAFAAIDQFAKKLNINAGLLKNQRLANSPKGQLLLTERYSKAFGDEFQPLLQDLKAGKITERVKSLLFSELSDAQPITKLELPQAYLDHPNGRILYQMKTYMLKQMDVIRRDAFQEIAKGNYVRGAKNLVAVAGALALSNVPGDIVKDWISGRPIDLAKIDWVENLLQNFGLNRYSLDKINRSTPGKGTKEFLVGTVTPPILGIASDITDKPAKAIKYIPGVGRTIYDRALGGNEARKVVELQRKRIEARNEREAKMPWLKRERLRKQEAAKLKRDQKLRGVQ